MPNAGLIIELQNFDGFEREVRVLDKILASIDDKVGRVGAAFEALEKFMTGTSNISKSLSRTLNTFNTRLDEASKKAKPLVEMMGRLKTALNEIDTGQAASEMSKFTAAIDKLTGLNLNKIQIVASSLESIGRIRAANVRAVADALEKLRNTLARSKIASNNANALIASLSRLAALSSSFSSRLLVLSSVTNVLSKFATSINKLKGSSTSINSLANALPKFIKAINDLSGSTASIAVIDTVADKFRRIALLADKVGKFADKVKLIHSSLTALTGLTAGISVVDSLAVSFENLTKSLSGASSATRLMKNIVDTLRTLNSPDFIQPKRGGLFGGGSGYETTPLFSGITKAIEEISRAVEAFSKIRRPERIRAAATALNSVREIVSEFSTLIQGTPTTPAIGIRKFNQIIITITSTAPLIAKAVRSFEKIRAASNVRSVATAVRSIAEILESLETLTKAGISIPAVRTGFDRLFKGRGGLAEILPNLTGLTREIAKAVRQFQGIGDIGNVRIIGDALGQIGRFLSDFSSISDILTKATTKRRFGILGKRKILEISDEVKQLVPLFRQIGRAVSQLGRAKISGNIDLKGLSDIINAMARILPRLDVLSASGNMRGVARTGRVIGDFVKNFSRSTRGLNDAAIQRLDKLSSTLVRLSTALNRFSKTGDFAQDANVIRDGLIDILRGVGEGFESAELPKRAGAAGLKMGESFINSIKRILRISSPSRVMMEIAQDIGRGFDAGLKSIDMAAKGVRFALSFTASLTTSLVKGVASATAAVINQIESMGAQLRRSVNNMTRRTFNAAQGLTRAGLTGLAGGGLAALLSGGAVNTAATFDQLSRQIQVFGRDAVEAAGGIEVIQDAILDFSAVTIFSANEAADAYLGLLKAGLDANEALSALPEVGNLAAAANMDIASSTELAIRAASAFGIEYSNLERVTNAFVGAADISTAEVADLGQAFGFVGNDASALGVSLEEVAAAMALLNDRGIAGERAGTALRQVFASLSKPTEQARQTLDDLGVSVFDASGEFVGFETLLSDLSDSLEGLPTENINYLLGTLGDVNAVSALKVLIQTADDGTLVWEDYAEALGEANTAQGVATSLMDTFKGAITSLRGSIETLIIRAMTPLLENTLKPIIEAGIDFVNGLSEINPAILSTASAVVIFVSALATLGSLLSLVGGLLSYGLLPFLVPLSATVTVLTSAFIGPLGLIAAVAALADVTGIAGNALETLQNIATTVVSTITTLVKEIGIVFDFVKEGRALLSGDDRQAREMENSQQRINNLLEERQRILSGVGDEQQKQTDYTVQYGDTLYDLARRYGTTVEAIVAANPEITDPNLIFTGQTLKLPGIDEGSVEDVKSQVDEINREIKDELFFQENRDIFIEEDEIERLSRFQRIAEKAAATRLFQRLFGEVDPQDMDAMLEVVGRVENKLRELADAAGGLVRGLGFIFTADFQRGFDELGNSIDVFASAFGRLFTAIFGEVDITAPSRAIGHWMAEAIKAIDIGEVSSAVGELFSNLFTFIADNPEGVSIALTTALIGGFGTVAFKSILARSGFARGLSDALGSTINTLPILKSIPAGGILIPLLLGGGLIGGTIFAAEELGIDFLGDIPGTIQSAIEGIIDGFSNADIAGKFSDAFSSVFDIGEISDNVGDSISGLGDLFNRLSEYKGFKAIADTFDAIKEALTGVSDDFSGFIEDIAKLAGIFAATAINVTLDAFSAVLGVAASALDVILPLLGGLLDIAIDIAPAFIEIGAAITTGLIDGVSGVIEFFANLAQAIIDIVKDSLGIASPSKKFEEIGRDIASGLAAGIEGLGNIILNLFLAAFEYITTSKELHNVVLKALMTALSIAQDIGTLAITLAVSIGDILLDAFEIAAASAPTYAGILISAIASALADLSGVLADITGRGIGDAVKRFGKAVKEATGIDITAFTDKISGAFDLIAFAANLAAIALDTFGVVAENVLAIIGGIIGEIVSEIRELAGDSEKLSDVLTALLPVLAFMAGPVVLGALSAALSFIVIPIATLITVLSVVKRTISPVIDLMAAFGDVIEKVFDLFKDFSLENIGDLLGSLLNLSDAFDKLGGAILAGLLDAAMAITDIVLVPINAILKALGLDEIDEAVKEKIFGSIQALADFFADEGLLQGFLKIFYNIGKFIFNAIIDGLDFLISNIPEIAEAIIGIVFDIFRLLPQAIGKAISLVGDAVTGLGELFSNLTGIDITGITDFIGDFISFAGEGFAKIGSQFFDIAETIVKTFVDIGFRAAEGFIEGLAWIVKLVVDIFVFAIEEILGFLGIASPSRKFEEIGLDIVAGLLKGMAILGKALIELFISAFKALVKAAPKIAKFAISALSAMFKFAGKIPGLLLGLGESVLSALSDAFNFVIEEAPEFISDFFNTVFGLFKQAPQLLGEGLNIFGDLIGSIGESLSDLLGIDLTPITDFFANLYSTIGDLLTGEISFGDFLDNIVNGITNAFGAIKKIDLSQVVADFKNVVSGAFESILTTVFSLANMLGIGTGDLSPSEIAQEVIGKIFEPLELLLDGDIDEALKSFIQLIIDGSKLALEGILSAVFGLLNLIGIDTGDTENIAKAVIGKIFEPFEKLLDGDIDEALKSFVNNIVSGVKGALEGILKLAFDLINLIGIDTSGAEDTAQAVIDWIFGPLESIGDLIPDIDFSSAKDILQPLADIIDAIASPFKGLGGLVTDFWDKLKEGAGGAINVLKTIPIRLEILFQNMRLFILTAIELAAGAIENMINAVIGFINDIADTLGISTIDEVDLTTGLNNEIDRTRGKISELKEELAEVESDDTDTQATVSVEVDDSEYESFKTDIEEGPNKVEIEPTVDATTFLTEYERIINEAVSSGELTTDLSDFFSGEVIDQGTMKLALDAQLALSLLEDDQSRSIAALLAFAGGGGDFYRFDFGTLTPEAQEQLSIQLPVEINNALAQGDDELAQALIDISERLQQRGFSIEIPVSSGEFDIDTELINEKLKNAATMGTGTDAAKELLSILGFSSEDLSAALGDAIGFLDPKISTPERAIDTGLPAAIAEVALGGSIFDVKYLEGALNNPDVVQGLLDEVDALKESFKNDAEATATLLELEYQIKLNESSVAALDEDDAGIIEQLIQSGIDIQEDSALRQAIENTGEIYGDSVIAGIEKAFEDRETIGPVATELFEIVDESLKGPDAFSIESPSGWAYDVGVSIIEGLSLGLQETRQMYTDEIMYLAQSMFMLGQGISVITSAIRANFIITAISVGNSIVVIGQHFAVFRKQLFDTALSVENMTKELAMLIEELEDIDGIKINITIEGLTPGPGGDAPGRQLGGPVKRGGVYEVNEGDRQTELYITRSGRQYLLAGEDGIIIPSSGRSGGQNTYISSYEFGDININGNVEPGQVREEILEAMRLNERRNPFESRARNSGRL